MPIHYVNLCVLLLISRSINEAAADDVIQTEDLHSEVVLLPSCTTARTGPITPTVIEAQAEGEPRRRLTAV